MSSLAPPIEQPQASPAKASGPAIQFKDVSIAFEQPVLDGVTFQLNHGETKVLLGESGTGKTLILKLALGLLKPDSGTINVLGEEISSMREQDMYRLRRRIGMVFQESALFDSLTVEQNVAYRLMEETGKLTDEIHARVLEALEFVELGQTYNLFPGELSGGMRRRVAGRHDESRYGRRRQERIHGGNARLPTLRGRSAWGWRLDIRDQRGSVSSQSKGGIDSATVLTDRHRPRAVPEDLNRARQSLRFGIDHRDLMSARNTGVGRVAGKYDIHRLPRTHTAR